MPFTNDAQGEDSHLGKSLHFRGEVGGVGDVVLDGHVEASICLPRQCVTVGPHGDVHGNIQAREVVIHGKLKGDVLAQDRVEIARTAAVWGDLAMARISIHDGAYVQGKVDIRVPQAAREVAPQAAPEPAGLAAASAAPLAQRPLG